MDVSSIKKFIGSLVLASGVILLFVTAYISLGYEDEIRSTPDIPGVLLHHWLWPLTLIYTAVVGNYWEPLLDSLLGSVVAVGLMYGGHKLGGVIYEDSW